jgi:Ion channel
MPNLLERTSGHRSRRLAVIDGFYVPDRYGLVLVLILITYLLSAMPPKNWTSSAVVAVQIATVWTALHVSQAPRSVRIAATAALAVAAIAAVAALFLQHDVNARMLPAVSAVLYVIAPVTIVRHLVRRRSIDRHTLLGAVDSYLLIGMMFAFVYQAVGANQVDPFFGPQGGDGTFAQILFFSFTTLTTTGYGNLVPAGNPGQTLATAEMLAGQLFLVVAIGKVVNAYRPVSLDARDGQGLPEGSPHRPGADDEPSTLEADA